MCHFNVNGLVLKRLSDLLKCERYYPKFKAALITLTTLFSNAPSYLHEACAPNKTQDFFFNKSSNSKTREIVLP